MSTSKIWEKLDREFGGGLHRGDETAKMKVDVIPFPSESLNDAVGYGGLPIGRISQFHGPEGSGKTMFAMLMVKEVQQLHPDSEVLWIDAEYSFDSKWAASLGIDLSRLRVYKENDGAKVFKALCGSTNDKGKKTTPGVLDLVENKELNVKLIVLDSIAQLIPPVETGRGFDEQEMAALARLLPKGFRVTSKMLSQTNCSMICINQAREKIGERIPTLTYPGGRSYRHSLSLAIQLTASSAKDNVLTDVRDNKSGHKILAKVEKTRGGPDKHRAEFFIDFKKGVVNKGEEIALLGESYGVITRPNLQTWEYKGESVRGKQNFFDKIDADPNLQQEIIEEINSLKERGVEKDNSVFSKTDSNLNIEETFVDDKTESEE